MKYEKRDKRYELYNCHPKIKIKQYVLEIIRPSLGNRHFWSRTDRIGADQSCFPYEMDSDVSKHSRFSSEMSMNLNMYACA